MHVSNTSYAIDLQKQKGFLRLSPEYWGGYGRGGLVKARLHVFGSTQSALIGCTFAIDFDVAGYCGFQLKTIIGFFWVIPLKGAVQSPVNALIALIHV